MSRKLKLSIFWMILFVRVAGKDSREDKLSLVPLNSVFVFSSFLVVFRLTHFLAFRSWPRVSQLVMLLNSLKVWVGNEEKYQHVQEIDECVQHIGTDVWSFRCAEMNKRCCWYMSAVVKTIPPGVIFEAFLGIEDMCFLWLGGLKSGVVYCLPRSLIFPFSTTLYIY